MNSTDVAKYVLQMQKRGKKNARDIAFLKQVAIQMHELEQKLAKKKGERVDTHTYVL